LPPLRGAGYAGKRVFMRGSRVLIGVGWLLLGGPGAAAAQDTPPAAAAAPDEEPGEDQLAEESATKVGCLDDLSAEGGRRKGVQKRDFLKRLRAELSIWGGFFAADLLSTSYDYGGAIAFYPGEDFGVEASLHVTPFDLAVEKPLTQFFAGQVFKSSLAFVVVGVWRPHCLAGHGAGRSGRERDSRGRGGAGSAARRTTAAIRPPRRRSPWQSVRRDGRRGADKGIYRRFARDLRS